MEDAQENQGNITRSTNAESPDEISFRSSETHSIDDNAFIIYIDTNDDIFEFSLTKGQLQYLSQLYEEDPSRSEITFNRYDPWLFDVYHAWLSTGTFQVDKMNEAHGKSNYDDVQRFIVHLYALGDELEDESFRNVIVKSFYEDEGAHAYGWEAKHIAKADEFLHRESNLCCWLVEHVGQDLDKGYFEVGDGEVELPGAFGADIFQAMKQERVDAEAEIRYLRDREERTMGDGKDGEDSGSSSEEESGHEESDMEMGNVDITMGGEVLRDDDAKSDLDFRDVEEVDLDDDTAMNLYTTIEPRNGQRCKHCRASTSSMNMFSLFLPLICVNDPNGRCVFICMMTFVLRSSKSQAV